MYKEKIDKNVTKKADVPMTLMNTSMLSMEKRVEDTRDLINNQIDEIEECQSKLFDEKNKPYKDIDWLKLDIVKLESQSERVQEKYITLPNKSSGKNYDEDTKEYGFKFMKEHPIESKTTDSHPILAPFQLLYLKGNHHAREVESHKFQKANLNVKFVGEDDIFTL